MQTFLLLLRESTLYKKIAPHLWKILGAAAVVAYVAFAAYSEGQNAGFTVGNKAGIEAATKARDKYWTDHIDGLNKQYDEQVSMWNSRAYENYAQYLEEKKGRSQDVRRLDAEINRLKALIDLPTDSGGKPIDCPSQEFYLGPEFISIWNQQNAR